MEKEKYITTDFIIASVLVYNDYIYDLEKVGDDKFQFIFDFKDMDSYMKMRSLVSDLMEGKVRCEPRKLNNTSRSIKSRINDFKKNETFTNKTSI